MTTLPSAQISDALGRFADMKRADAPAVAYEALADQLRRAQLDHPRDNRFSVLAGYVQARARFLVTGDEAHLKVAARLLGTLDSLTDAAARSYGVVGDLPDCHPE